MKEFCIHGVSSIILRKIDKEKYILIQQRKKGLDSFETGLIEIPCGKVKKGESVFECLRNKVFIETGLKVTKIYGESNYTSLNLNNYEVINYVPFFSAQNIMENYPIVIDTFICETEGEPISESQDARNIRWISIENLNQLLQDHESLFYPMVVVPLKQFIKMEMV